MFTASISGYMNMALRRTRRQIALSRKNLTILAVGVFGFSGLCAALPFITNQYVELGPRCWIAEDEEGRDRNAGVAYRFIIIAIIWFLNGFIFVCYYEVIKYLRETVDERTKLGYDKQIQRTIGILMYYPSKRLLPMMSRCSALNPTHAFSCTCSHLLLGVDSSHRHSPFNGHPCGPIRATRNYELRPCHSNITGHIFCNSILSGRVKFLASNTILILIT
jgi:hypothetical protein